MDNVDMYRQVVDAWNRGDVDVLLTFMNDDVEVSTFLTAIEGDSYAGHRGVRRWWQNFHDMFPDWHARIEDLRGIDDATLARLRMTGHGRDSGAPVDQQMWHVVRWREGKISRLTSVRTEPEALKAVGPEE
jgi:ketosteroid isomerase-like protein